MNDQIEGEKTVQERGVGLESHLGVRGWDLVLRGRAGFSWKLSSTVTRRKAEGISGRGSC